MNWWRASSESMLKFFKILFVLFSVSEALRAYAAKRLVFGCACLAVFAVGAGKVFAASDAGLRENHFRAKDAADCVYEFFDVVVAFNRKKPLLTVVVGTESYEKYKFFFLHPRQLKPFRIQNNNHAYPPSTSPF
jgi:hypothetical protein